MIREERHGDRAAVRAVELSAFEGELEADIVDALRGLRNSGRGSARR